MDRMGQYCGAWRISKEENDVKKRPKTNSGNNKDKENNCSCKPEK